MDMSNSLLASGFRSSSLTPITQAERQSRLPASNQNAQDTENSAKGRSLTEDLKRINSAELIKKGESIQAERLQRLNTFQDATLKGQQAINSYQQTIDAAQQFEGGELIRVDLYV